MDHISNTLQLPSPELSQTPQTPSLVVFLLLPPSRQSTLHLCTQPPRKTVCYICSSSLSPGCTASPFPPPTPGALPAMVLVIPPPIWPPPPDSPKMYRTLAGWATAGVAVRALQLGILQQPLRTGELMTSPFFVSRSSRWKEGKGWEMS